MTSYTLTIGGKQYDFINLTFIRVHPNPDCDSWFAYLPFREDVADEAEVEIKRNGTSIFKGIVEERSLEMGTKGVVTKVGGRHTKVKVWRNWIERNEDPKAGGFWLNYYPHDIIQFYLYPSKSDVADYHRSGWGIDPQDAWAISTNPAGSYPNRVKDRYITLGWLSGANQAAGHYVCVDLGSAKSICAIRVENRIDTNFAEDYKIQYSNTSCASGFSDVVTVTSNAANNIVHAFTAVSARYWRIYITGAASPAKEWTVGEIYLYESDGTMSGISEGTLTAHAKLDEAVDFTYMRRTDAIQKIVDLTETANVPWEWWVTDAGAVNLASRRGSDLSATVQFVYSVDLESDSYKRDSKEKVERIKVLGKGKGNDQDVYHASAWVGSGDYEKVVVEKGLEDVTACTTRANVLRNELQNPLVLIRCNVVDTYATGTWGVGDDITLTDSTTGLSGSVRVKKITRKYDGKETVMIECSNYRQTVTERFAKVARALEMLQLQQDEFDSIKMTQLSSDFLIDLLATRPAFMDEFKKFDSVVWSTVGGTNPVNPDVQTVDNFPALRIRTAGASGDTTYILTEGQWSGPVWRYQTKLKIDTPTETLVRWGLSNAAGTRYIYFVFAETAGPPPAITMQVVCKAEGVAADAVNLNNFPSVDDWHVYRFDWVSGSEVKFYIDGLLVATITTSIPTNPVPHYYYIVTVENLAKTFYIRAVVGQRGAVY